MGQIGRAALGYFLVVFAAGFALGVLREGLVRPRLGEAGAIALEGPAVLLACWLAARWAVRRFAVVARGDRLWMGLAGFALLMAAELAGAVGLRGMTAGQWVGHFAEPAGLLSLALFVGFAVMPVCCGRPGGG